MLSNGKTLAFIVISVTYVEKKQKGSARNTLFLEGITHGQRQLSLAGD